MASSDEEGEIIPDCVTSYYFVNYKEEPVSFAVLPLQWSEDVIPDGSSTHLILRGTAASGLQKIYKEVIAWKFELSCVLPEIYILPKDKIWIKLQRPRKSFEVTIKTILITVHFLHFVKKNPETSGDALWNHLLKVFRSYEVEPSENDLLDHMPLIKQAAMRDKDMGKSKYLTIILLEMPGKREAVHEENQKTRKSNFIVDTYGDNDGDDGNGGDDECDNGKYGLYGYVCALCDNGGDLLSCEGRCLRSFHATVDAGAESFCESLGYTDAQVEAIPTFLCKNCQCEQHLCFVCGMLGSSNKSSGAEVFPCVSATCGYFYHPKCVAELLHPWDGTQAEELKRKIISGESFTCPAHKCTVCKHGEDKMVNDLQFALCRRCPKAYHRKCLPRNIAFESNYDKNVHQRAWDGLLPNRILIYCMDHKIIPELGTPARNHILFPNGDVKKKQLPLSLLSSKEKAVAGKSSKGFGVNMQKPVKRMDGAVKCGDFTIKKGVTIKPSNDNSTFVSAKAYKSYTLDKIKSSLRIDQSNSLLSVKSDVHKSKQQHFPSDKTNNVLTSKSVVKKASSTLPLVDAEMKKGILMLMKSSTSSFNMEEFVKKQKSLSTHAYSSKAAMDKTITEGKVEGSVKAVQAAVKKLEEGCTIEDAKAVCEPEVLNQLIRWKRKLGAYLAPFLHGMRYTSFGRHFTKVDKLKEIVDRLQWYVQDGDMIVDFCCGSNDFSCLMKEKLEKLRKRCSFRNYDLITPKNDFNFEKRDWLSVQLGELPAGSRLIMGLNPPFGIANKLIDQALRFKPKLLILIVPKETKRLDEKDFPYDIIWEDDQIVSGKSFYLPGSVDVHDQQLDQWNLEAPPLCLWSHPNWTAKHKEIAQKHCHLSKEQGGEMHAEGNNVERVVTNYLMEESHECFGDFSSIMEGYGDFSTILDDVPEVYGDIQIEGTRAAVPVAEENILCSGYGDFEDFDNNGPRKKHEIGLNETSQTGKLDKEETLDEMCVDRELSGPVNSPVNFANLQSGLEGKLYGDLDRDAEMNNREEGFHQIHPSHSGHHLVVGTESGLWQTSERAFPNATESGYWQASVRPFPSKTYIWPTGTNYGLNSRCLNTEGPAPSCPRSKESMVPCLPHPKGACYGGPHH